jgi:hypothetical protein
MIQSSEEVTVAGTYYPVFVFDYDEKNRKHKPAEVEVCAGSYVFGEVEDSITIQDRRRVIYLRFEDLEEIYLTAKHMRRDNSAVE